MENLVVVEASSLFVPFAVKILADLLKNDDPDTGVYIVGGAVRDYLFALHHGDPSSYVPKDVDLTTNLSEEEILARLSTEYAVRAGVTVKEKESVDTFGVVFASVSGSQTIEIAPFRKDVGGSDGRHPDRVERGTIRDDAMRRDLTFNNLYFDLETKFILDLNPNGQGLKDVKSKTARMVGDPAARFDEDKLRVLRFVRFFSRFNPARIVNCIDDETKAAIEKFKRLYDFKGITGERIQMEFMAGMKQSQHLVNFMRNYEDLDLFENVFPGMHVDVVNAYRLGTVRISISKNPRAVLAWLLRKNENVGQRLNELKYPNEISEPVQFLVNVLNFDAESVPMILKSRDRRLIRTGKKKTELTSEEVKANERMMQETWDDLTDLASIVGYNTAMAEGYGLRPDTVHRLDHLRSYQPPQVSGEDLMSRNFVGRAIGAEQQRLILEDYFASFDEHMKKYEFEIRKDV